MARKPRKAEHADPVDRLLDAALDLAGEQGWRNLSLGEIAARAGMSMAEAAQACPSRQALLSRLARRLDQAMLEAAGVPDLKETARDRLFEVLMARFDAMNRHRDGIVNILRDTGQDPISLLCGACGLKRSMALALEAAGLSGHGLRGALRIKALAAAYLYVLRAWMRDDSPDMARTMAALDKALAQVEELAAFLSRSRKTDGKETPPEPPVEDGPAVQS